MAVGTDKILGPSGANMMGDDGKLTAAAKNKFILDVLALQLAGNEEGKGLSKLNPLLAIPIPPFPGPTLQSLNGPTPFFWFKSDPYSLLSAPYVLDANNSYQKFIIDGLYEPLVKMLNVSGKTIMGPVFDPTIFIDLGKPAFKDLKLPALPGILIQLVVLGGLAQILPMPGVMAKAILFSDFGIADPKIIADLIPLLLAPPIPVPPVPQLPKVQLPDNPNGGVPKFFLPEIVAGIFKMPAIIFPKIIGELTSISLDPPSLLLKIIEIILGLLLDILKTAGMFVAPLTLLSSTLVVLAKNLAGMILCDLIGSLFGTGMIVKIVGTIAGLS